MLQICFQHIWQQPFRRLWWWFHDGVMCLREDQRSQQKDVVWQTGVATSLTPWSPSSTIIVIQVCIYNQMGPRTASSLYREGSGVPLNWRTMGLPPILQKSSYPLRRQIYLEPRAEWLTSWSNLLVEGTSVFQYCFYLHWGCLWDGHLIKLIISEHKHKIMDKC